MTIYCQRGSEWRKWDLHLHAPHTKLNNQFRVNEGDIWDEYCRRLHESDVHAFGITDYFSAETYFRTTTEYHERYAHTEKVFFPNIELRTGDVVNPAQEEVNVHLIFNPFRPNCCNDIRLFLQYLKTNKTIDSGRHVRAINLTDTHDFEEATTTREFIRDALLDTYGRDANLLDCLLIATAANNDGIRAARGKKRKLLITDEIDKFSNCFFGSRRNVDHFLRSNRGEDKTEHYDPKPVLSGSDAHSFLDLRERMGQVVSGTEGVVLEPTWIKADLTFEGLKQIIFEPQNRVFIGTEPEIERRVRERRTKYIDRLHINNIDGYEGQHGNWFCDENIHLGKELVAIIGNKGSGKSAVTDIIGLLGNSHTQISRIPKRNPEELFSFLNREKFLKGGCAKNFSATLFWYDGKPDSKLLDAKTSPNLPEKVEYLPQKYLEKICADIADNEFRATLNKVVFHYLKPQQRHGQKSLDDLIGYLSQQADSNIQNSKRELHLANERVVSIEKKLVTNYKRKVKEEIRLKKEELSAHISNRPVERSKPPDADSPKAETEDINKLTREIAEFGDNIDRLQTEQIELSRVAEELRQIRQAIDNEAVRLRRLEPRYEQALKSAGLSFGDIVKVELDYSRLDALVAKKVKRFEEIEGLLATDQDIREQYDRDEDVAHAVSVSIVCKKRLLQVQKSQLVERQAKPARKYQEYLIELNTWTAREREIHGDDQDPMEGSLKGREKELDKIKNVYPNDLRIARAEQARISKEVFQKKRDLTRFYDAIKSPIDAEIAKYRDDLGDYEISIEAGLRFDPDFIRRFLRFINQGRKGSFYGTEDGTVMLRGFCDEVDDWENDREVFHALNAIVDALHFDKRSELSPSEDKTRNVFLQMRNQEEPVVELYDYLFGFDYLKPKYDLKVDQKDLSELSPGERGGLLLIFYLILDRQDIPLVIDQPEDNLDNKSVYEILVTFIKMAKQRRQIILVTHNPNLAVVADAEQIIHVSIDKTDREHDFDFFSGSIENPSINEAVIDILEGTLPAFDNRRLKYRRP